MSHPALLFFHRPCLHQSSSNSAPAAFNLATTTPAPAAGMQANIPAVPGEEHHDAQALADTGNADKMG